MLQSLATDPRDWKQQSKGSGKPLKRMISVYCVQLFPFKNDPAEMKSK
jgi:hypothetical protein